MDQNPALFLLNLFHLRSLQGNLKKYAVLLKNFIVLLSFLIGSSINGEKTSREQLLEKIKLLLI